MKLTELAFVLREALPTAEDVADALDLERLEVWLEQSKGDRLSAERTMNHVHMLDALRMVDTDDGFDTTDLLTFTDVYVAVLRDRLAKLFPDTTFVVETFGREEVAEDPLELIVTYRRADAG